jgi:hypothetical protein
MAQLRLNANGIEAIEALFAQLRGFASYFRARDAADSTNGVNSVTTRPNARVCTALARVRRHSFISSLTQLNHDHCGEDGSMIRPMMPASRCRFAIGI